MKSSITQVITHSLTTHKSAMLHVHYHDMHELYYMKKGSTTYYIGDKIYHIQPGDFVFIPKGILHKTDYEDSMINERIHVHFDETLFTGELTVVRDELHNNRVMHIEEEKLPYLERLLNHIQQEDATNQNFCRVMLNLYITELLVLLCRYKQDFKPTLSGADQTIYSISKYISKHYQEPLSLTTLSQKFGLSESHLSRKFKANTGIGIIEYITYVRITNAEKILRNENLPVTEVAGMCGYTDSNYFSTVFKRIKGVSPQKYQKHINYTF